MSADFNRVCVCACVRACVELNVADGSKASSHVRDCCNFFLTGHRNASAPPVHFVLKSSFH